MVSTETIIISVVVISVLVNFFSLTSIKSKIRAIQIPTPILPAPLPPPHLHKFGDVQGDYQVCIDCGKAEPIDPKCPHVWKQIDKCSVQRTSSRVTIGTDYTLQCEKCGVIDYKRTRINKDDGAD